MTLTINVPAETEERLKVDAARMGLSMPDFVIRLLTDHYETGADHIRRLADEIAVPGYVKDLSREAIYAE
jgi:plasmid stability protein